MALDQETEKIKQQIVAFYLSHPNATSYDAYERAKALGITDENLANQISDDANNIYKKKINSKANLSMLWGGFLLIVGFGVTVISFNSGGTHVFAYGAIIVGLIRLISGAMQRV
jgi:hypothetical protein